jgi:hypothetical protein
VRRSVAGAGTYKLKITLTAKAKRALKRKLKVKLHVAYAPANGAASSATVSLTVEPAARSKRSGTVREAGHNIGGAR